MLTKSQLEIIEFTRNEFDAYPNKNGMYEALRLCAILKWPDHAELFGPSFINYPRHATEMTQD